jgi:DNA-directed RNA polymerase specialized sigma24 family protein
MEDRLAENDETRDMTMDTLVAESSRETTTEDGRKGVNRVHRENHPVALLRASLRAAGGEEGREARHRAAIAAAQPLIDRLYKMLLSYCDYLVWQSALRDRLDGADVAHDTWVKVLRYLSGEGGDRIEDENHLRNLLRVSAKRRLLDLLEHEREMRYIEQNVPESWDDPESAQGTALEHYPDTAAVQALEAVASVLADGPYRDLVVALFTDEARFHRLCWSLGHARPRRRLKQYQAFVIAQMATFLRREARREVATDDETLDEGYVRLMREFVRLLGIPAERWERVEEAVRRSPPTLTNEDGLCEEILMVINKEFNVELQAGNYMSVLKHELSRFAGKERKQTGKQIGKQ